MSESFILGVNYWPRRKAMYWWSDFDAGEVREEFAVIRDLGMTVVRIFLLWDDWQPTPDSVSADCLRNLGTVLDIAAEHGLGLDVTFFTGHMSGPNWSPKWLLDPNEPPIGQDKLVSGGEIVNIGYRNSYIDPVARAAQRLQVRTVVDAYKDHPGVWMWNLGNEPDLFAIPPDEATAIGWLTEMRDLIKGLDPQHLLTCGLHSASLFDNRPHRIHQTFNLMDVPVMHSYPQYIHVVRDPLDPDWVPYTCALTSALCGKPTLMEEFGGCTNAPGKPSEIWKWQPYGEDREVLMASEDEFAAYIEAVLPKLVEVGATGAMMWCYADYIPELWDKPPCRDSWHERFFGLVRPDGTLKPHAEVIKRFAATQPTVQPAQRTVTLDITPDAFYEEPALHTIRLYEQYKPGGIRLEF
ncbi:MAG: beta-galactosidase [Chloroflexi bacterium]|uniref:glycoside hydrolase 5 family protein n=1 Tax=Candidatus Flexifilum breve TaxID=3140694 RepID=UPI0031368FE5|nr:beta-galactosidase [Chloroflexota bacterium]